MPDDGLYQLHKTIFWICVVIGMMVLALLLSSLLKYRQAVKPTTGKLPRNNTAELIWVVIPSIVIISLAIPATLVLMHLDDHARLTDTAANSTHTVTRPMPAAFRAQQPETSALTTAA